MVDFLKNLLSGQRLRKQLLNLLAEMEKNLEIFYVADQRQFITRPFLTQAWEQISQEALVRQHEAILVYAAAIADFNRLLKEHREYEQWYASDLKNKTPENGRKLHILKQAVDQKLKSLEAVIVPAGQALERQLLQ